MFSFMQFARVEEMAVIKGIREYLRHVRLGEEFSVPRADAVLSEELPNVVKCDISASIHLKRLPHYWCALWIDYDALGPVVI